MLHIRSTCKLISLALYGHIYGHVVVMVSGWLTACCMHQVLCECYPVAAVPFHLWYGLALTCLWTYTHL